MQVDSGIISAHVYTAVYMHSDESCRVMWCPTKTSIKSPTFEVSWEHSKVSWEHSGERCRVSHYGMSNLL